MSTTHYDTLEVSRYASQEVIKAAYRALMTKYHPDKHPDKSSTDQCSKINAAYDILSDCSKKNTYDQSLTGQSVPQSRATNNPPQPVKPYTYDPEWELFLQKRPWWVKSVPISLVSWRNPEPPIIFNVGMSNIRPDLQDWGYNIIVVGQQNRVTRHDVQRELERTWGYFCTQNSLDKSLVLDEARIWVNRAFGEPESVSVKFGM